MTVSLFYYLIYFQSNNAIDIIECDLASDSYESIRERLSQYQPFDSLVNSAGIGVLQSFLDFTVDHFDEYVCFLSLIYCFRTIAINLRAPAIVSQIVAKEMIAHSIRGTIVHLSSQASIKPLLHHTAYCKYTTITYQ